ncbi:MAG: non-ribosomal peptide synthetase [Chitinophagaceae bacterium]
MLLVGVSQREENLKLVPIGKPVSNTYIYILDSGNGLVPLGIAGEIHIGGVQVGRGYLNRPDLTAEKFIIDRYRNDGDARIYKTGDLGRWLTDGNIEYLGRKDDQVKIRGYRIELGEIESVLQQCDGVSQGVVLAREDGNGNKRLIGYVVPEENFDKKVTIQYLKNKLPEYMVPAIWMELEAIPKTSNGKIDRKALPDPEMLERGNEQDGIPRSELEIKLADIWKNLLGVEWVGIHNNFFELGGHSLLAMRLISAIRKELRIELFIKDIFQYTTISLLSEYIEVEYDFTEEIDTTSLEEIKI